MRQDRAVTTTFGCRPTNYFVNVASEFERTGIWYDLPICYSEEYSLEFRKSFSQVNPKFTLYPDSDGRNGVWFGWVSLLPHDYFVWILMHGDLLNVR